MLNERIIANAFMESPIGNAKSARLRRSDYAEFSVYANSALSES